MLKSILKSIILFAVFVGVSKAYSQGGKISGYMFGDYYYVANNHDSALEGRNGFWFRRIYFTYDQAIGGDFAVRFRMELASPGNFTSAASLDPFLKDGYLKWAKSGQQIILGLSPTPTWNYIEDVWGYRSVEKTPADLYKLGSSRDFGISFGGNVDSAKKLRYHFMFANGSSGGADTNKGKKLYLSLIYQFTPELSIQAYTDWEDRPGRNNRYSGQGFITYQTETYRLGAQFTHQTRQSTGGNTQLQVGSVFGVARLSEQLWGFLRYDRSFDPIPDGPSVSYIPFDGTAKINFLLAGLDFRPHEQIRIMPNIETVFYTEVAGSTPQTDFIPRLTFFYIWK